MVSTDDDSTGCVYDYFNNFPFWQKDRLTTMEVQQSNKIYEFKGYIEGNEMMNGNVNVIVTDGFTGNVALKTAEGTYKYVIFNRKSVPSIQKNRGWHVKNALDINLMK